VKKTAAEIQTRDQAAAFEFGLFKAAKALKMSKTGAMHLYNTALRKFARKLSKQAGLTMPSTPGGTLEQMQSATPPVGNGFLNQLNPAAAQGTMGSNFFKQMRAASPTPQAQAPAPTPPPAVPPVRPAWTPSFQTSAPAADPNAFTDETADAMAAAPKPDIMEEGAPLAPTVPGGIDMNYEGAGGALTPELVRATNNAAAAQGRSPVYGTR
jgi:hypothetical protein